MDEPVHYCICIYRVFKLRDPAITGILGTDNHWLFISASEVDDPE